MAVRSVRWRGAWMAAGLWLAGVQSLPAAVLIVDPAHAHASDAGPGTAAQPLRTIGAALGKVEPGDVVQIGAGTYREPIDLRHTALAHARSDARTVIEGRDLGKVVIKGSDPVKGWQSLGDGRFVRHDWKVNSQQVFVDGKALRQVGGRILGGFPGKAGHPLAKLHAGNGGIWPGRVQGDARELPYGSFYYDRDRQDLYVRVHAASLDQHRVEVSVRPFLVLGEGITNLTLRNLVFRHANTTDAAQSGAVSLRGDGLLLEQLDVQFVDGAGLDISGDHNVIKAVTANYCGQLGIKVRGNDAHVIDNDVSFNNTRGFNKWWEAGGAKFVGNGGLKHSVVSGNVAVGNDGDGIWFDWLNEDNRITDNVVAYNKGFGIQYEASSGALIRANQVFGNTQRGIYLPNSRDSRVEDNIVVANGLGGIVAVDARHGSYGRYDLRPRNNEVVGNILAWNEGVQLALPEPAPEAKTDSVSNRNLIVTRPGKRPSFSEGFGTRTRPKRVGLAAWRQASGQDGNSVAVQMELPAGLRKALTAQDRHVDWSVLQDRRRDELEPPRALADERRENKRGEGKGS